MTKRKKHYGLFGEIIVPVTHKYQVVKPFGTLKIGQVLNLPTNVDTWSLLRRGIVKRKEPKK